MNSRRVIYLLFALVPFIALGQPRLPYFFSDNMVLQQKTNANIWGWDEPGKTVKVTGSWNKQTVNAKTDGSGKWKLQVATPAAGGPYEVMISDGKSVTLHNVLIGEVWLCSGQSNMEMPLKGFKNQPILGSLDAIITSENKNIRLYTVPRSSKTEMQDTSKASPWKEADPESASNFSATAYFFGKQLESMLHVPIGLLHVSYSGSFAEAWMSADALKPFEEIKIPAKTDTIKQPSRTATTLYNGMLHPVIGYTIKGAIWYQGESNYERPDRYEQLFPAMVQQWRSEWNIGNFPFYYVQIAPYDYAQTPPYNTGGKYNSAYLRDAQRKCLDKIPNSGMAVVMDIGEPRSIHPAHKQEGGKRLALLALANDYSLRGFESASPLFDSLKIDGSMANISFKNAPNGITSYGKELTLFEIAGADKNFRPGKAVITAKGITVSSPEVGKPVAVRYAFKDFVAGELFSNGGLPVSSFRTDDW